MMVDLFHFVPIIGHVRRPADVIVLPDDRHILDQVQPGAEQPIVTLRPLCFAHVLIKPALHEGVESLVHCFRHGWMRLEEERILL